MTDKTLPPSATLDAPFEAWVKLIAHIGNEIPAGSTLEALVYDVEEAFQREAESVRSETPRIRVPLSEIAHMTKRLREYNPVEGQEGLRLRDILMREAAVMIEDLVGPPQTTPSAIAPNEQKALASLIVLARALEEAMGDGEEMQDGKMVLEAPHVQVLENYLDHLLALPDDRPGYTLSGPARAHWALRRLIDMECRAVASDSPAIEQKFRAIGMVYRTPDGVVSFSLEPNTEIPAEECIVYVSGAAHV